MIVYFDSSSIVKWFFDEPHMDLARNIRDKSASAVTSLLSFPEVMSAIRRAMAERRCSKSDMELVRQEFLLVWPNLLWVQIRENLMREAGELVYRYSLKGYDAVHLASALTLKREAHGIALFFSCFDKNLNRAARKEGFMIHQEIT